MLNPLSRAQERLMERDGEKQRKGDKGQDEKTKRDTVRKESEGRREMVRDTYLPCLKGRQCHLETSWYQLFSFVSDEHAHRLVL